jgi:hypothetical protein
MADLVAHIKSEGKPLSEEVSVLPDHVSSEAGGCARRAFPVKLSIKRVSANSREIRNLFFILVLSAYDAVQIALICSAHPADDRTTSVRRSSPEDFLQLHLLEVQWTGHRRGPSKSFACSSMQRWHL